MSNIESKSCSVLCKFAEVSTPTPDTEIVWCRAAGAESAREWFAHADPDEMVMRTMHCLKQKDSKT